MKKTTAGRRPNSQKTDVGTRASILAAARRLFARKGFDGTSVRDVAKSARVNNAMIYYFFKDKLELYRAVLSDSFATLDRIWEHEVFKSEAPVRRKMQKYVEEFIRFQHSNEELRRIIAAEFASCGKNMRWIGDKYFSNNYNRLAHILKEGMASGELVKINPATAVASLIGMIIHPFILKPVAEYVSGKNMDISIRRFTRFVVELFFDGLSRKPSRCTGGSIQKMRRVAHL